MGKKKKTDREFELVDRLKHENSKLKRQISLLRKQFSRIDLENYKNIEEIIQKHDENSDNIPLKNHEDQLKKLWECFSCRNGVLVMVPINKLNETYYFRKCNQCNHRTKLKKLTKDVKRGPTS